MESVVQRSRKSPPVKPAGILPVLLLCLFQALLPWLLELPAEAQSRHAAGAGPAPDRQYLRFERSLIPDPAPAGKAASIACALLPSEVFAHAAPSLTDLRVYTGETELPYATTLSQSSALDSQPAQILHLSERDGRVSFDLAMPPRPYTEVTLDLAAKDFLLSAKVEGRDDAGSAPAPLGEYTLFDLSAEHLSRNTTLNLQESTFPILHVELTGAHLTAAMVRTAEVPPSREAQTLYTSVATAVPAGSTGGSVAIFRLPAHVPVERVRFDLPPGFKGSFRRTVHILAHADGPRALDEELTGEIARVELTRNGHVLRQAKLSVPATLGVNMHSGAVVTVTVDAGDGPPLPLAGVRLEMRERKLCFDPPASSPAPVLFYGDPSLRAPVYEFARHFATAAAIRPARLEAEQPNPAYTPRLEVRPLTDRYPDLLWVALLLILGIVAVVTFRSARRAQR